MAKDALIQQDAKFAEKIARRDESVVAEVQRAYAEPLRRQAARFRGSYLDDHDIDDIVTKAIEEVWDTFDSDRGCSVRIFLFRVGKRRTQDRLKRNSRRRKAELTAAQLDGATPKQHPSPDEIVAAQDASDANAGINRLLARAVDELTDRQRNAVIRRFAVGGDQRWAKQLEEETGVPAKQWRKASADGLSRLRIYLAEHGVRYLREEGRYEVA